MSKQRELITHECQVCHLNKPLADLIPATELEESMIQTIRHENPDWSSSGYICYSDLNHFRTHHLHEVLSREIGELSELEKEVARSIAEHELLAQNLNQEFAEDLTFGTRLADKIASFGGSWKFIIIFTSFIFVWICINSLVFIFRPFDVYPFILLNLMLSCLAALQAPVIMMSQNRQDAKDRMRSEHDYKVNLKAELEIRHLNEKLDHLINHQLISILEAQESQMEMLNELMELHKNTAPSS